MHTCAIFTNPNPFDAVNGPAKAIGSALEGLNFTVEYVNMHDVPALVRALNSPLAKCDLAISLGPPAVVLRIGESWMSDMVGGVFFYFLLDPLVHEIARYPGVKEFLTRSRSSPRLKIMSPDRATSDLINEYSPDTAFYVPFGGFFHRIPRQEPPRCRRIAVVGTIGGELAEFAEGKSFADLVQDAPAMIRPGLLPEFARQVERAEAPLDLMTVARRFLDLTLEQLLSAEVCRYLARLDSFQKRRRRALAVRTLREYPVDFYGCGWERVAADFRDSRFPGWVPHHDVGAVCRTYAAVLSFDPNWDHGLHDRVYTGVGNGCRIVTNRSGALDGLRLPDPEQVLTFDANQPELGPLAERALFLPSCAPEALPRFRMENGWFARMDQFLMSAIG